MYRLGILFLLFPAVLGFSGCSTLPGMRMDESLPSVSESLQLSDGRQVELHRITPELILEQAASPASPGLSAAESIEAINAYSYRVGPRDILSVTVWEHPELTIPQGEYRSSESAGHLVDTEGYIYYPYVGRVMVEGMTPEEIRMLLAEKLAEYINNPQMDVRVASYRSKRAYIVGEVREPGPQVLTDIPLTVVDAVNSAGGAGPDADLQHVTLTRDGRVEYIDLLTLYERGNLSDNLVLRHGDILFIPDRNSQKIFVLGEVKKPGSLLMHNGRMSLAEALSEAGGINLSTADAGRIYVVRGTPSYPRVFHLNMRSADALILADAFPLQARDAVYVDSSALSRWNRSVISQIAPTLNMIVPTVDLVDQLNN